MNIIEEEVKTCALCGNDKFELIWDRGERRKQKFDRAVMIETKDGRYINSKNYMCCKCGLVFVNPKATKISMDEYYVEQYRKDYSANINDEMMHSNNVVNFLNTMTPMKGKSLDMGCGNGFLVKALSQEFKAYGIDQNRKAVVEAQKQGLNVIKSDIADFYTDDRYDLITIINTLEHQHDITAVLDKINQLLAPTGKLLVVVPSLYTGNMLCPVDAFFSCAHLYTFDTNTIVLFLLKSSFKIEIVEHIFEPGFDKLYVVASKIEVGGNAEITDKIDYVVNPDILKTRINAYEFIKNSML